MRAARKARGRAVTARRQTLVDVRGQPGWRLAQDVGPLLIDTVRREVRERVRLFPVDKVRIESSALQEKSGLWGGVALAIARVKRASGQPVAEAI